MPRFPNFNPKISDLPGSVYEKYRDQMKKAGSSLVKLHIGDTCLHPPYDLALSDEFMRGRPDFNRYCNTYGVDELRRGLAEKLNEDNGLQVTRDHILVTNGATNALSIAAHALLESGDEIIVLTPAWPFFFGMVRLAGSTVVEVPLYIRAFEDAEMDVVAAVEKHVTARTAAIYLNTPNNPSGKVLNRKQIEAIASVARKHDLWVISDEAYDGMTFHGREHVSIASLPGMFERTVSIFTFSKIFMVAGFRLGYVAATDRLIHLFNKIMVHQIYSPSTVLQYMVINALKTRHSWMREILGKYESVCERVCGELEVPVYKPEGTYFIFMDACKTITKEAYWPMVEACVDQGVAIAPGGDFGADFRTYIRICFTGESEDKISKGIRVLNSLLRKK